MATNTLIERLGKSLIDELTIRLGTQAAPAPCVAAHDSSGDLYITVTRGVGDAAIVKFEPVAAEASGAVDYLGLTQVVYTPHVTKLGIDAGAGGAAASDTATLLAALTSTDVLTVNSHAFTAMNSGAAGDQFNLVGTQATGTVTLAGVVSTNTVVINGVTLTATAATQDTTNFIVGGTDIITATNLVTTIAANPTLAAIVTASNVAGTSATVTLVAIKKGTAGNAYTLADGGSTHYTVSAATMGAGIGQTVGALDLTATAVNVAAAIAASATPGVLNVVTATSALAVVTVRAVSVGVAGNAIPLTQTGGHITVATATLAGGTNATAAGTSDVLRNLLVAVTAPTGTALLIYEKAGIVEADLINVAYLTNVIRNIPWGQLASI